jgi:hypothetical protein
MCLCILPSTASIYKQPSIARGPFVHSQSVERAIVQYFHLPNLQRMLFVQPFVLGVLSALLSCLPLSLQQANDGRVQNLCRRWGHQTCVIDDRLYLDGGRNSLTNSDSDLESNTNQSSITKSDLEITGTELTKF